MKHCGNNAHLIILCYIFSPFFWLPFRPSVIDFLYTYMHICLHNLSPSSYTCVVSVICLPIKRLRKLSNKFNKEHFSESEGTEVTISTIHSTSHAHYSFMSCPSCLEVDEMMVELQTTKLQEQNTVSTFVT